MCILRWTVWNYDPCRTLFIMFWQSRTHFLKRTGSDVVHQLCWTAFLGTLWLYKSLCAFSLNSTCASFLNSTERVLLPTTSRDMNNFKDGLAPTTSISTHHVHKNNHLLKVLSERLTSRLLTPVPLLKGHPALGMSLQDTRSLALKLLHRPLFSFSSRGPPSYCSSSQLINSNCKILAQITAKPDFYDEVEIVGPNLLRDKMRDDKPPEEPCLSVNGSQRLITEFNFTYSSASSLALRVSNPSEI